MEVKLRYRGREIRAQDVAFINALIDEHPEESRRALSKTLCQAWDWRQPNGQLKDMVCRSLMLELHRAGHIELPPVRCRVPNNVIRRSRPAAMTVDSKPPRREPFLAEPKSLTIVGQDLYCLGATIAENEECTGEGITLQCLAALPRQAINPLAKIRRIHRHQDPHLRGNLDHRSGLESASAKATTSAGL